MPKISNAEKRSIIKKLREYQENGTDPIAVGGIKTPDAYRWTDILAILAGGPYCLTTSDMIDRIIELIEP